MRRKESVSHLYALNGLLTIDKIYEMAVASIAFKTSKGKIPDDIALPLYATSNRATRRRTVFDRPHCLTCSRHALAYRMPATLDRRPPRPPLPDIEENIS